MLFLKCLYCDNPTSYVIITKANLHSAKIHIGGPKLYKKKSKWKLSTKFSLFVCKTIFNIFKCLKLFRIPYCWPVLSFGDYKIWIHSAFFSQSKWLDLYPAAYFLENRGERWKLSGREILKCCLSGLFCCWAVCGIGSLFLFLFAKSMNRSLYQGPHLIKLS